MIPCNDDDALRYDQGIQVCSCGDLTVSCYQGRPCCPGCYPERRKAYLQQQASPVWHNDREARAARRR